MRTCACCFSFFSGFAFVFESIALHDILLSLAGGGCQKSASLTESIVQKSSIWRIICLSLRIWGIICLSLAGRGYQGYRTMSASGSYCHFATSSPDFVRVRLAILSRSGFPRFRCRVSFLPASFQVCLVLLFRSLSFQGLLSFPWRRNSFLVSFRHLSFQPL